MGLSSGKTAEVMFDRAIDTYEHQDQLLELTDFHEPDAASMQNSENVIWYPKQQHVNRQEGWDLTGNEGGVIEEVYPSVLGLPQNVFTSLRIDSVRDSRFWERQGEQGGLQLGTGLNSDIAAAIATQGSLFYRSNATSGYDFISPAQAIMNERQGMNNGRCFLLNDRDAQKFSSDLAARQTLQGQKVTDAWSKSQIGANVAGFNVYNASYLPNVTGAADPAVTVTGNQSFKPESGTVNATTKAVTNVDYRSASLVINDSALMAVGDKFQIENSTVPVQSLALADKVATGQPMTFTVITITDGTHIEIFPKPIAADDGALTALEAASANINTQILNAATITRLNTDTTNKTNLFWDKKAVEVIGGTIPAEMLQDFAGLKVIHHTLKNGLVMYMIYDASLPTLQVRYRLFVWYGITICDPSRVGSAVTYG